MNATVTTTGAGEDKASKKASEKPQAGASNEKSPEVDDELDAFFDEITNSLDRNSVDDLLRIVKTLINKDKNVSILWATHRTDEIDAIADTVLNLREGNVSEVYKNRSAIK